MPASSAADAQLLITHPNGGRSFDYQDYWDGADLIYTGRGQVGDQLRKGANLDVAENRRKLLAFEAAGAKRLRYLGSPQCVEERRGRAPDNRGIVRTVLQFRLRFSGAEGVAHASVSTAESVAAPRAPAERRPRAFSPDHVPSPPSLVGVSALEPEEILTLQEKAARGHHELIVRLNAELHVAGWTEIAEIPSAIDLWGRAPSGIRVIFEAKTISDRNEMVQTRSGLAQALEYRILYGEPDDLLCLVTDRVVALRRARILDALGVGLISASEAVLLAVNDRGSEVLALLRA